MQKSMTSYLYYCPSACVINPLFSGLERAESDKKCRPSGHQRAGTRPRGHGPDCGEGERAHWMSHRW